jgi:alpha-1,6-mannosyltransferase
VQRRFAPNTVQLAHSVTDVSVHFHSYPLQTGASLFTFLHSPTPTAHWPRQAIPNPLEPTWRYFKSEDPGLKTPGGAYDAGFEYVVTDDVDAFTKGPEGGFGHLWEIVRSLDGLEGVRRGGKWGLEVVWGSRAAVLRRV